MGKIIFNDVTYTGGGALPEGGVKDDILVKQSAEDGDAKWQAPPPSIDAYTRAQTDALLDEKADKATTYTKSETDALLDEKAALTVSKISTAGGGQEIHATVSQGQDAVDLNYYKKGETPDYINLNVGEDSFRFKTAAAVDASVPFIATYESTTYEDVKAAIDENRAIVVDFPNNHNIICVTFATYANGQNIVMSGIYKYGNDISATSLTLTPANAWSISNTSLQEKLSSGQNIKTVNNQSLLGSGNIDISSDAQFIISSETTYTEIDEAIEQGRVFFMGTAPATVSKLTSGDIAVDYQKNGDAGYGDYQQISQAHMLINSSNSRKHVDALSVQLFDEGYGYGLIGQSLMAIKYGEKNVGLLTFIMEGGYYARTTHFVIYDGDEDRCIPVSWYTPGDGTAIFNGIYNNRWIRYTLNCQDPTTPEDASWSKEEFPMANADDIGSLSALQTTAKNNLVAAVNEVNGKTGVNIAVGKETWYGTYTDENGVTYQVYTKTIYIPALAGAAGATTYPHGITNIKQILSAYGFTTDGFVLNAPRQNVADNISIYQVQKSATGGIVIEVGKDRSSKKAYVTLIYAKNN